MKDFFDNDVNLNFIIFGREDLKPQNINEIETYNHYNSLLNEWTSDKNIREYICDMKLGDFFATITRFSRSYKSKLIYKHLFAFDNSEIVGSALLTINDEDFKKHIGESENFSSILEDKNPLFHIEYLAVNPSLQNNGYGSRIIKAIKNNYKIISDNKQNAGFTTVIHKENEPSKRAFLKNKFVCTPASSYMSAEENFSVYYFGKHDKSIEKDI